MNKAGDLSSKFYFVGDLSLAGWNNKTSDAFASTFKQWQELTEHATLTVANFESCLIEDGSECNRFMAVPKSDCDVILDSGIDVLSLANNHILDCGEESLNFTRSFLQEIGFETVGAGKNIDDASAPLIISKCGVKIGILSSTDATHYKATGQRAGIAPLSLKRMRKSINQIIEDVDIVVLCIHSDLEFTNYPSPWKVKLSRQLAKSGADIIIHHHPHTLQGIEIYQGSLIAYSLGNFLFPVHSTNYMDNRDGYVNESVILEVNVKLNNYGDKTISYNLLPTVIDEDNVTRFASAEKAENIISKMSEYSLYLNNRGILRKRYLRLCLKQARNFIWGTYYTLSKNGVSSAFRYLHIHFSTKMHRNWMRGIFTLGWL